MTNGLVNLVKTIKKQLKKLNKLWQPIYKTSQLSYHKVMAKA